MTRKMGDDRGAWVRRAATAAVLGVLLLELSSGPDRAVPADAQALTTPPPGDFVVLNQASNTILRYTSDGVPDPAPGVGPGLATFIAPASTTGPIEGIAFGPDGNLYVADLFGTVTAWSGTTGAPIGTFLQDPQFLALGGPLTFGPDGDMYIVNVESALLLRYCGPLDPGCTPGTPDPLPSHTTNVVAEATNAVDMAFGPDGNLYLVFGSTIQQVCGPLSAACSPGTFAGFSQAHLTALAFGPDGNLYVSDQSTSTVLRVCGPDVGSGPPSCTPGAPLPAFNQSGAVFLSTQFTRPTSPMGIDFQVDGFGVGDLYVADRGGDRILRYFGPFGSCLLPNCAGTPDMPGLALVPPGASMATPTILKFPHPAPASSSNPPPSPKPVGGLLVDASGRIDQYNATTGAFLDEFAFFVPGGSNAFASMALGPDGNLYVPDSPFRGINRIDGQTGALLGTFVLNGTRLSFGPDGNLYAGETKRVTRIDIHTGQQVPFVSAGSGGLTKPTDLAFGPDGNLYVASSTLDLACLFAVLDVGHCIGPIIPNNTTDAVLRFDGNTGAFIDAFVPASTRDLHQISAIAFGPDGNLYVANADLVGSLVAVLRFDGRTGAPLGVVGTPGSADFIRESGPTLALTFGPDGNLFIADRLTIQRFDAISGDRLPDLVASTKFPASSLLFRPQPGGSIQGAVFKNSVSNSNALPGVQIVGGTQQLGFLTCPLAGLLFLPCPAATTDVSGQYALNGLAPGAYVLTAFPPANVNFFPGSINVTVPAGQTVIGGQNIVLLPPAPLPNGVRVTLSDGSPSQVVQGVPVLPSLDNFQLSLQGCPGGSAHYTITLVNGPLTPVAQGSLSEIPESGLYSNSLKALSPNKGLATVGVTFHCPDGSSPEVSFLLYIDPSGTVIDDAHGVGIRGATVTLLRSDSPHGPFVAVPGGSAQMALSNRTNPDQTDTQGHFGWDVVPGYYRLQASAPGHTCQPTQGFTCTGDTLQSGVLSIPPAAIDLQLPLHRVGPAPVPATTASVSPQPNAAGWNRTNVTVSLSAADPAGGYAIKQLTFSASGAQTITTTTVSTAATSLAITAEGQSTVTYFATDAAGISEPVHSLVVQLDKTPPHTQASLSAPPNAAGWNRTDVTVTLSASDAASGVAQTDFNLDGAGFMAYTGPITLSTEGVHSLQYHSVDRADNTESVQTLTIKIDKTAPEAFFQFDPTNKNVLVFGRDSLSGVEPGPIPATTVAVSTWDRDDDEDADGPRAAHTRTYVIQDLAGNTTTLLLKVRADERTLTARVLSLQRNDGPVVMLPPNRARFEWTLSQTLAFEALEQQVDIGRGADRQRLSAHYQASSNQTVIESRVTGGPTQTMRPGMDLLRVLTSGSTLAVES